jgi:ankyrin repeat protein
VNVELDGRKPIHFAADFGQNQIIDYLLSKGADVNSLDQHGITPLLAAIWEGRADTVKLLLAKVITFT